MKQNKFILFFAILLFNLNSFGQKRLDNLRNNSNFEWIVDSIEKNMILYYEKNSYAEKNNKVLKLRVKQDLRATMEFIGIDTYEKPIHYFILEDREKMKRLIGYETNGNANIRNNFVTTIFSENIKSAYGNHELFHLIAMNEWGYGSINVLGYDLSGCAESWINEGMAVYSDGKWYGYDLHELSKYLLDNNKFISIRILSRKMRKYDSKITYPLLGSFAKFIDETYGRETIKLIWTKGRKKMKSYFGKSIYELENEWIEMLKTITYNKIEY